jgi:hypothetical protein
MTFIHPIFGVAFSGAKSAIIGLGRFDPQAFAEFTASS